MVRECFNCGVSEEKMRLFDAISNKGIDKICKMCSLDLNVPVLNKPTSEQITASEGERISSRRKNYNSFSGEVSISKGSTLNRGELLRKQETALKDLVDKNFEKIIAEKKIPREDLIDNFHWIIMRARRLKKLTQSQLAKEINESDSNIKMVEQGILPGNDFELINKLEKFLGIKISKGDPPLESISEQRIKPLRFSHAKSDEITISDLKNMKENTEEDILDKPEFSEESEFSEGIDEELDIEEMDEENKELSEKEMDDILFGK